MHPTAKKSPPVPRVHKTAPSIPPVVAPRTETQRYTKQPAALRTKVPIASGPSPRASVKQYLVNRPPSIPPHTPQPPEQPQQPIPSKGHVPPPHPTPSSVMEPETPPLPSRPSDEERKSLPTSSSHPAPEASPQRLSPVPPLPALPPAAPRPPTIMESRGHESAAETVMAPTPRHSPLPAPSSRRDSPQHSITSPQATPGVVSPRGRYIRTLSRTGLSGSVKAPPCEVDALSVSGLFVIANMDGTLLRSDSAARCREAARLDLGRMLGQPGSSILIDSFGGKPLTICFHADAGGDRTLSAAVSARGRNVLRSKTAQFTALEAAYRTATGIGVPAAVDYPESWVEGPSADSQHIPPLDTDYRDGLSIAIGSRVQRNRASWIYGDDDGGEGLPGTVLSMDPSQGWVTVRWDATGTVQQYRYGGASRVWDIQPFHIPAPPGGGGAIAVGARVRRNPACWDERLSGPFEHGMGTVVKVGGEGLSFSPDGPTGSRGVWATVRWDTGREGDCRWGIDGKYDISIVAGAPPSSGALVAPPPRSTTSAVRCIQVTVLSCRGVPPSSQSRVQIAFEDLPPETTSVWEGEVPAWGEKITLDVPSGLAGDLTGRMLRVTLLAGQIGATLVPVGGCAIEVGHLAGPVCQTLWVAMDPTFRSRLIASPHHPRRSLQTTVPTSTSCWLRLSVAFGMVDLQHDPLHSPPRLPTSPPAVPIPLSPLAIPSPPPLPPIAPPAYPLLSVSSLPRAFQPYTPGPSRGVSPVRSHHGVDAGGSVFSTSNRDTSVLTSPVRRSSLPRHIQTPQREPAQAPVPWSVSTAKAEPKTTAMSIPPAAGDATSVVEYLVQLGFDSVTVFEVARLLKKELVEDVGTLKLLSEADLAGVGVPLGCRRKIAASLGLTP